MKSGILAFLIFIYAIPSFGAVMYRYKDENGGIVLDLTVPAKYQKQGYEILNQRGRVIEVVPPAPTEEEIAERKYQKKLKLEREKREAEQKAADDALVKVYSEPDAAIRALTRDVQELQGQVKLVEGNIVKLEKELAEIEVEAANRERAGQAVTEKQLSRIKSINEEIIQQHQEITQLKSQINDISTDYLRKINRLKIVTKKDATLPLPEGITEEIFESKTGNDSTEN